MKAKRRVYFGLWGNQEEMLDEFQQPPGVLFGRRVLLAKLDGETGFDRTAFVLLEDRQGRLFKVFDQIKEHSGRGNFYWTPLGTTAEEMRFTWHIWDDEPSRLPDFALDTEFMEALDAVLRERE